MDPEKKSLAIIYYQAAGHRYEKSMDLDVRELGQNMLECVHQIEQETATGWEFYELYLDIARQPE